MQGHSKWSIQAKSFEHSSDLFKFILIYPNNIKNEYLWEHFGSQSDQ